jgi:2-hydroxychromene-2-carboxylate isomerase
MVRYNVVLFDKTAAATHVWSWEAKHWEMCSAIWHQAVSCCKHKARQVTLAAAFGALWDNNITATAAAAVVAVAAAAQSDSQPIRQNIICAEIYHQLYAKSAIQSAE